jgi:hypothetical protein
MWTGYSLFNEYNFQDFAELRAVLREQLGDVESLPETTRVQVKVPQPKDPPPAPHSYL